MEIRILRIGPLPPTPNGGGQTTGSGGRKSHEPLGLLVAEIGHRDRPDEGSLVAAGAHFGQFFGRPFEGSLGLPQCHVDPHRVYRRDRVFGVPALVCVESSVE